MYHKGHDPQAVFNALMIFLEILFRSFNTNILFQNNFRKTDAQKHTTQKTLGGQTTEAALLFITTNLQLILCDTNTYKLTHTNTCHCITMI